MPRVFKKNDVVVRVEDVAGDLPVGTICTVLDVCSSSHSLKLKINGANKVLMWYSPKNFRLAKKRTPHVHCDLITAWAEGEDIQYFADGTWHDVKCPSWNEHGSYRIKPENDDRIRQIERKMRELADELAELK